MLRLFPFRIVLFLLAALGAAGAGQLAAISRPDNPVLPPPNAPAVKPWTHAISAAGLVEAAHENTRVGAPVGALVKSVEVKVWDKVKAGDILFRLDDREILADLVARRAAAGAARAEVAVAAAERDRAAERFARWNALAGGKAVSVDEIASQKAGLAVAEARALAAEAALQSALAEITRAEALAARLVVRSPIDATVLRVNIRPGEFAAAGAMSDGAAPVVIGGIDTLQLRCDIDEQVAPRMREGLPAVAYLKGDTASPIPLTFARIEPFVIPKESLTGASVERVDTRVLQVIYRFASKPGRPIYVGQRMDVSISEETPPEKK